ncbi:hypothetical protein TI03_03810, partial [Achromatium sp. WMS1]
MRKFNNRHMNIINKIVNSGYCIGCGACSVAEPKSIKVNMNDYGQYEAKVISKNLDIKELNICPFSDNSINEDAISDNLFKNKIEKNQYIGYYHSLYAGYVQEDNYREKATSGGLISWILCNLLMKGNIDYVIHVKENKENNKILFKYDISSSVAEILEGAKSRYYPVEISKVLEHVKNKPGKYAFVGLPCFVKAVRLLMNEHSIIKSRVRYCIGLVCGHLKSKEFANFFAWQAGILPEKLKTIDFRLKLNNENANNYGVYLKNDENVEIIKPVQSFFGFNWRNNFFRCSACSYCDDVFAETADMVVGDAWLPEYINDPKGNSVVVVRNEDLAKIIDNGRNNNKLNLDVVTPTQVIESQAGGIRDRREGLSYRLFLKQQQNEWYPKK